MNNLPEINQNESALAEFELTVVAGIAVLGKSLVLPQRIGKNCLKPHQLL